MKLENDLAIVSISFQDGGQEMKKINCGKQPDQHDIILENEKQKRKKKD